MHRIRWIALAVAFLVSTLVVNAWAADKDVPEGFVSLFNGHDLSGW